jgi:hypothetical protein
METLAMDLALESLVIADSANLAAPASSAESAAQLRRELADCIADAAAAEEHMTMIGRSPDRVRAYFKDPRVKYVA